jgi:hypothetical protein
MDRRERKRPNEMTAGATRENPPEATAHETKKNGSKKMPEPTRLS